MSTPRTIRLAFSPDADDAFMFLPLLRGRVPADGLTFVEERVQTEALNARTESADPPDVCAVSIAHVPAIADRYLLLPHGGSVGRGYGPVVVARRPMSLAELAGKRVAIPGARTTAYLVLRLLVDAPFTAVEIPITPFSRVFEALTSGEVDAALLIHEGRLTYEDDPANHLVVELGESWKEKTGLPLPLGGNVVRRDLGDETIRAVSRACRASITWSLAHRDVIIDEIIAFGLRAEANIDRARLDRYLGMYANVDSAGYDAETTRAIRDLIERGVKAGLLGSGRVQFAEE